GLGRQVAVKRLRPQLANMPQARDRLLAEAKMVREVHHEHVVNVLDVVSDPDGESYFVMEHLAGEPLSARIARTGALPLSEALALGLQVASAIEAVHRRGIIHRDLKTENVLVSQERGGGLKAKLIDFGVAEVLGEGHKLIAPTVVGTPESMAPEQALGGAIDHRCDIYSFGVLLYEMVTGAPPFHDPDVPALLRRVVTEAPVPPGETPGAQRHHIPIELDRLILECLAKKPAERPRRMRDVRARLERIAAGYREMVAAIDRALEVDEVARGTGDGLRPATVVEGEEEGGGREEEEREEEEREARRAERAEAGEPVADQPVADQPVADQPPGGAAPPATGASPAADEPPATGGDEPSVYDTGEEAWFERGEADAMEEVREEVRLGSSAPTASRRLGRAAGAALFVAAIAAGLLGLMGHIAWSPLELEALWPR
ncbi:MAG TPA: serine/threonine-protein kinase, partial [Kofleriaceae bacterium]|nr:serine/threonine-protein kinase [Kofleriaceae bacterium]